MRYDIISDTHGWLAPELLDALQGADVIVHAGDCCKPDDYKQLAKIAPVHMCLGNNDYDRYAYPPDVDTLVSFRSEGLRWQICHYEQRLKLGKCDIAICGHTHRSLVQRDARTGTLVMNPGSPTYPRGGNGATMGRILVEDGKVVDARIIPLEIKPASRWFSF